MKLKPTATLFFLLAIMLTLVLLMTVFPKNGISISNDITLYFPTLTDWLTDNDQPNNKISLPDLVEEDQNDNNNANNTDTNIVYQDIQKFDSSVYNITAKQIAVENIRQPLELPPSGLKCLENLFAALINPDELSKVVRILHYGDSQIETDRISNYLRFKLQQQFGGSGPGLVPAKTPYDYKSPCKVDNYGQWDRYTIFPKIDTAVKHSKYGILASFSRFSPIVNSPTPKNKVIIADTDSVPIIDTNFIPQILPESQIESQTETQLYSASLKFTPSTIGHANVRTIKRVTMFYGNSSKTTSIKIKDGETTLYSDSLPPNNFFATRTWYFNTTPEDFRMDFESEESPDIYAFAMDGLSGVTVDNIALRGCSGTIFTKMNGGFFGSMYKNLNAKCIILQFGGNTVPYLTEDKINGFKSSFVAQIRYLKRLCPNVSIIVIGPADMSTKVQDKYETYEVLPPLVEAMRSAALNNDCAFWDMYSAMGGKNTMPDWVFHEPPYAEKDFVHFTPNGANIMARMFYNALISRYNEYIKNK